MATEIPQLETHEWTCPPCGAQQRFEDGEVAQHCHECHASALTVDLRKDGFVL